MAEIRVEPRGEASSLSSSIQMQGFAGSINSGSPFSEQRERDASVRSEPDMDTIMPLPGGRARMTVRGNGNEKMGTGLLDSSDNDSDDVIVTPTSIGFTSVEHPVIGGQDIFGDDLTTKALDTCRKTVLHPYMIFLKIIGWRRFRPRRYDLVTPRWLIVWNVLWPSFVCGLLVASCITQIITCFRRDTVVTPFNVTNDNSTNTSYNLDCRPHLLTTFIIPDILLILSFVYGLYIFRSAQTEQLATLTEAVFLGHINRQGKYSHKRLITTLQTLMVSALLWMLFSLGTSIFRGYTLHLLDRDVKINWIPSFSGDNDSSNLPLRWVLVVITILGFIVLDMAYTAVVVNYCFQCQLLIYLFKSIGYRMLAKEWGLDHTIREVKTAREFLSMLNSHLSRAVSLLLFIFLALSVQAVYGLQKIDTHGESSTLIAVLGFLAALQWVSILVLPLVQAARVTKTCNYLKRVVGEIRARPYSYKETPQLDLDSLVVYSSGLSMSAKLASVPMTPALVVGVFFVVGFAVYLVFQYDSYSWASWL